MCHINLFFKRNLLPIAEDEKIINLINAVSYGSFVSNSDGEGYIAVDKSNIQLFEKSEEKIFFSRENLGDSYIVVTHERLTTSGRNNNMTHPHIFPNITLLHNGVFSGLGENHELSDTFLYTEKLSKIWDSAKPRKCISEVNKVTSGYFSIVLRDHENGKIYYYKNHQSSFYILRSTEYIFCSTSKGNLEYIKRVLKLEGKIKDVSNLLLFDVLNNFQRLGKIDNTKIGYGYTKDYSSRGWEEYGYTSKYPETTTEKAFSELPFSQKKTESQKDIRDYERDYFGYGTY